MRLPRTSRNDDAESCALLPSNMRTLWNRVTAVEGCADTFCVAAGNVKTAARAT